MGISYKPAYTADLLRELPTAISWVEVHPENYMGAGGLSRHQLDKVREHYEVSLHGVGLSLGSAKGVDRAHIDRLDALQQRYQPWQMSEHISWSMHPGQGFLNDLLPLPLTEEVAALLIKHIDQVQQQLGRQIMVENPSVYIELPSEDYDEPDFINHVLAESGAGLLLDINNVYVSCHNQGHDAKQYLNKINAAAVGEIHLAGHKQIELSNGQPYLIDDHGSHVADPVLDLLRLFSKEQNRALPPILLEWDTEPPPLDAMLAEVARIRSALTPAAFVLADDNDVSALISGADR